MLNLKLIHDTHVLFDDRYELKRRLGGGGFSEVWLAFDTKSLIEVALKVYVQAGNLDDDGLEMFRKEFSVVCNFNHGNILRPFSYETANSHPYLVLPYCSSGASNQFVGKMTEDEMWKFIKDVSSGLDYLHSYPGKPVIHQDIKPANILIDATGKYMITDFGISVGLHNTLSRNSMKSTSAGTISYMSPERFDNTGKHPVISSDIWALGATLYELATGDLPFGDLGGLSQIKSVSVGKINKNYSSSLKNLIYSCLALNPWERPSAKDLYIAATSRKYEGKKKSKPSRNKLWYMLPIALVLLAVSIKLIQDDRKQKIIESGYNHTALTSMNKADMMLTNQKILLENDRTGDKVCEDTLLQAIEIYENALKVNGCSDSVYVRIRAHKDMAIRDIVRPTYEYLQKREDEYRSIGAFNAANHFRTRQKKLADVLMSLNYSINDNE